MDTSTFLESIINFSSDIIGRPFGSWQFWTATGVGILLVFIFGKVFARGIGKSEKSIITVFIGNAVMVAFILMIAWAFIYFAGPYIEETWLVSTLAGIIAVVAFAILAFLLGPVFWAESRWAAFFASIFALALGYAAVFATEKVLDIFESGSSEVQNYKKEQKEALPE